MRSQAGIASECESPWILPHRGAWASYRWRREQGPDVRLRIHRLAERRVGDRVLVGWRYELSGGAEGEHHFEAQTLCVEDGVEVPWLGLPYRASRAQSSAVSALLPARPSASFAGEVTFSSLGNDQALMLSRHARVRGRERVSTPLGEYEATRLEITQTSHYGGAQSERRVDEWLVAGIGLVKYEERAGGRVALSLEIDAVGAE